MLRPRTRLTPLARRKDNTRSLRDRRALRRHLKTRHASRSARSTASTRVPGCSTSIPTSASTAVPASRLPGGVHLLRGRPAARVQPIPADQRRFLHRARLARRGRESGADRKRPGPAEEPGKPRRRVVAFRYAS
ncbi:4Fe-4S ferredoxin [Mycobacterium lepraemurium]|nr:4Fe-4S ferredoxin [Mycobacterium lepraemurium]